MAAEKPSLVIALGKAKPGMGMGKPAEPMGDEAEAGDLEMASGDLLSAIKAGDPKGVAEAFRAMSDICGSY